MLRVVTHAIHSRPRWQLIHHEKHPDLRKGLDRPLPLTTPPLPNGRVSDVVTSEQRFSDAVTAVVPIALRIRLWAQALHLHLQWLSQHGLHHLLQASARAGTRIAKITFPFIIRASTSQCISFRIESQAIINMQFETGWIAREKLIKYMDVIFATRNMQ